MVTIRPENRFLITAGTVAVAGIGVVEIQARQLVLGAVVESPGHAAFKVNRRGQVDRDVDKTVSRHRLAASVGQRFDLVITVLVLVVVDSSLAYDIGELPAEAIFAVFIAEERMESHR